MFVYCRKVLHLSEHENPSRQLVPERVPSTTLSLDSPLSVAWKHPSEEKPTPGRFGHGILHVSRGHKVDYRSDIFSFGIVLHEMLTGEAVLRSYHTYPTCPSTSGQRSVVSGHYQVGVSCLRPEQSRCKMQRIQCTERCRIRLRRTSQDGPGKLDDVNLGEEPEHRLASFGQYSIRDMSGQAQPIERSQALDLDKLTSHTLADSLPFFQSIRLADDHAQQNGRVEISDHRSTCRCSSKRSAMSRSNFSPLGRGTFCREG